MQKVITLGLRHMVSMYSLIHRGVSKNIKRQWMTKKEYMDIAFDQKNPSLPPLQPTEIEKALFSSVE